MESEKPVVIDLTDNPKNSALYFDSVIPLSCRFILEHGMKFYEIDDFKTIFPLRMQEEETFMSYIEFMGSVRSLVSSDDFINDNDGGVTNIVWDLFRIQFSFFFSGLEIKNYVFLDNLNTDNHCKETYERVSLKLAKLPLIDTSKADWKHILEIRKDKVSINKLRKLKTFFHKNYSGKEKNYIQDDLLSRIEEYNNTVKDWGFETITSSLTLLNTSITSVGSSLILALTGQPLEVAAASGICVGIGNVVLHLAKEKHKLMKLGRDHPLAYIIETKKKLEKD